MKNIYHIAENMSLESGGVRTVIVNLDNYLNENKDFKSSVLTNKKENNDDYFLFTSEKFKSWNYSKELGVFLNSKIDEIDILHLHGVFMHTQYMPSKLALKFNIPYVVSPHGMLEPWHMNDKKIKKKIYFELILKEILSNSNILHAITPLEKKSLFELTGHKNIIEIPNLIHYNKLPKNLSYQPTEEYFLFLSRLHPKKGLGILIEAFSKIENKKIKLKIAGTENKYSDSIKVRCKELNISDRVEFLGGVYGDEKYQLFANAKAFVSPSYSEAIGMVNLEAASSNTPVITSFNTGINPEWGKNGGVMIVPDIVELTNAMNEVCSWNNEERIQRGLLLSEYVLKNYSWEKKGILWDELYNSIS